MKGENVKGKGLIFVGLSRCMVTCVICGYRTRNILHITHRSEDAGCLGSE